MCPHAAATRQPSGPCCRVQGVEHLLSALEMLGVDNARIEIEGGHEVPIIDGSALGWAIDCQAVRWLFAKPFPSFSAATITAGVSHSRHRRWSRVLLDHVHLGCMACAEYSHVHVTSSVVLRESIALPSPGVHAQGGAAGDEGQHEDAAAASRQGAGAGGRRRWRLRQLRARQHVRQLCFAGTLTTGACHAHLGWRAAQASCEIADGAVLMTTRFRPSMHSELVFRVSPMTSLSIVVVP